MTNHQFLLTVWLTFFNDLGGGLAGQSLHRIYGSSEESESRQGKRGSKATFSCDAFFLGLLWKSTVASPIALLQ